MLMANGSIVIPFEGFDYNKPSEGERFIVYIETNRHTFKLVGVTNTGFTVLQECS
jgi:hypothetical protein